MIYCSIFFGIYVILQNHNPPFFSPHTFDLANQRFYQPGNEEPVFERA